MRKIFLATAGFGALLATPAMAQQTSSDTLVVSVNVVDSCQVDALPLSFGSQTGIGGSDLDYQTTVNLTCTLGADYAVTMGAGAHSTGSGGTLQRFMAGTAPSTETVPYNLYTDAARSTLWLTSNSVGGTAASTANIPIPVYGRIPASANAVTADSYTDNVTVTVTF